MGDSIDPPILLGAIQQHVGVLPRSTAVTALLPR